MVTAKSDVVKDRFPRLARILELLSKAPGVKADHLAEIRNLIGQGKYLTEEKLNIAICRLLKDILG